MTDMQTFLIATFISVLCDIIYTIVQGSRERVALFQYLSPIVLGISLVSAYMLWHAWKIEYQCAC